MIPHENVDNDNNDGGMYISNFKMGKMVMMEEVCLRSVQTLQRQADHRPCFEYVQGGAGQWSLHLET